MTNPPTHPAGPQQTIAAALDSWWLTADPTQRPDTADAAETIEFYLASSGYRITPDTRKARHRMPARPSLRAIVFPTVLTLALTVSAILAVHRGDWAWAAAMTVLTVLPGREAARDIRDRRKGRAAR
ncbi:hypothetical protein ACFXAZ_38460 [Streptomyces sp. NPDC059477]|uniref:hypothetical protein n=1 Tax=Streptomyces sp. NPDC059477 TaxID=3346847 RepID=UPI00368DB575